MSGPLLVLRQACVLTFGAGGHVPTDQVAWRVILPATPKMVAPEDGDRQPVRVFHPDTGEALSEVCLAAVYRGGAHIIKVTLPDSGVADGVVPGALVVPVGLACIPWAVRGSERFASGVVYRADGLEPVTAPAVASEEADPHATLFGPPRAYPVTFTRGDERFSEQLVKSMAALLVAHGYPPVVNVWDWSDFETALARFLYRHNKEEGEA